MSREVDRLALPQKPKQVKVFIASASRTGTLGLYTAMQMLGYTPYHMKEICFEGGVPHMKMATEAITAQHNRFSGIKKYREEEFKKRFANYDCLIEIPSFLGMEALEAYAKDPSIKFILTERDPEKWANSLKNGPGKVVKASDSFPMKYLKHFNTTLYHFMLLSDTIYFASSDSTMPGDPDNMELLKRNYMTYINNAKRIIPKDQLRVIRLEDGLGWEQICPFLDLPVPDEPYPRGNEPAVFKAIMEDYMGPLIRDAMIKTGSLTVAVLSVAGWAGWKYFTG